MSGLLKAEAQLVVRLLTESPSTDGCQGRGRGFESRFSLTNIKGCRNLVTFSHSKTWEYIKLHRAVVCVFNKL